MNRKTILLFLLLWVGATAAWGTPPTTAVPLAPTLEVSQTAVFPGAVLTLTGAGYTPGDYAGTVRWDGVDVESFLIEAGGSFERIFFVPATAAFGDHVLTVCSLYPCATGEFEQSVSVTITVQDPHTAYMPLINGGQGTEPPPFTHIVDPTVEPLDIVLPEFDGQPRPLAAVADPRGNVATYVANELVVQTDDTAALNALLAQYGGTVLLEIDPATADITDLPKLHLVRLDTSTIDLSQLTADLAALNATTETVASGLHRFSSEDGLELLAVAGHEATEGLSIGLNWVAESDVVPTNSFEANTGISWGGIPYNSNAYNWHFLNRGSIQDIGTAEAWNVLYYGGRWGNRVKLAVLDGGFAPNADFTSATYLNVFPFPPENVRDIEGNWHGTHVYHTAMARSGNNFGVVGVAHTVGEPILVYTSYDYFVSIASVTLARAAGAKIINMSYSADVPAAFSWTVLPFELTTAAIRASGALLFASAGNSNRNVDGRDCFIVCWEHTLHTPCENAGVICVGGLDWNSRNRADYGEGSGSNWGSRSGVHIFAPYLYYRGPDPDNLGMGSNAGVIAGTSFSSPYTAAVAALIWAADPALSANQVWQIMRDTAHLSDDPTVPRYVNAYAAVRQALGTGGTIIVESPADGSSYQLGFPISFLATIGYVTNGTAPVNVNWTSSLNGLLHTDSFNPGAGVHDLDSQFNRNNLAVGTHTITVQATGGFNATRTFTVNVLNTPPVANITNPSTGASVCEGEEVVLSGTGTDVNQPSGLPDSAFGWYSNLNDYLGPNPTLITSSLNVGLHTLTLRVTDNQGVFDEDSISLTVLADTNPACVNNAPTAQITSPANGYSEYANASDGTGWYITVNFVGQVGDAETPIGDLVVTWESSSTAAFGTVNVNPTTGVTTVTARLYADGGEVSTPHTITLTVDDGGRITTHTIIVTVLQLI